MVHHQPGWLHRRMVTERMDLGPAIMQWLDELAECSEDPAELTRRYLTPEHARAAELVMRRMREAGMSVYLLKSCS